MPTARKKSIVAILSQEIDAIHVANLFYWKSADRELGREARVEYERRRERLEEIRRELRKQVERYSLTLSRAA
jgi:hypothetical protein